MLRSRFMGPAALVVAVVLALAVPLSGQERKKADAAGVKGTLLSVDAAKDDNTVIRIQTRPAAKKP
jgi:hypothetical protein